MGRTKAKLTPEADRKLKQARQMIYEYRRQVDALQSSKYHNCCTCVKIADDTIEAVIFLVNELLGEE